MKLDEIAAALEKEIERLRAVRDAIARYPGNHPPGEGRLASPASRPKSKLSAAARERIAAAQRKRWAKQKQVVVTIVPPKEAPVKRPRKKVTAKVTTALTGQVPTGPVAAPPKAS